MDQVEIPEENLLGQEGEGFKIAMKGLDGGRINIGTCSVGAAQAALNHTQKYMNEREQFGKPLSKFQALQFKVADMLTHVVASRQMIRLAASKLDQRDPGATVFCAMAKRMATDLCFDVCNEAIQIHGGYGYSQEYPVERLMRDARVHQILEGTNEIMRVIISRKALDPESFQKFKIVMSDLVLFSKHSSAKGLGEIQLNSPKSLNSINTKMVLAIQNKLDEWKGDESIQVVFLHGQGEKAFCAGGDVRSLYGDIVEKQKKGEVSSLCQHFFEK